MPDTPDEELVRRLLADARHDEPMPADVVARLDGVLDELAAEAGTDREVVSLRARREHSRTSHRRRWAAGLVAAAVVVVGGVAGRSVWPDLSGSSDSAGGSSSAGKESASDSGGSAVTPQAPDAGGGRAGIAELHRATLLADVRRAVRRLAAPMASMPPVTGPLACTAADRGPGTAHPARLDGRDALLVLRPPAHRHQVADVLECGSGRVLASATLPAD